MIDLMALAAIDRETEVTYIRRERDWAERAPRPRAGGSTRRGCSRCCRRRSRACRPATAHGHGDGHDH